MAKENGWWEIKFSVEVSDQDRKEIARLIKNGMDSGNIAKSKLN